MSNIRVTKPAVQGTQLSSPINTNLSDIGETIGQLGRIQHALKIADNTTISVCRISNEGNVSNIERLLDPALDEAVDMEVSTAFTSALRGQARVLLRQLESMGINLDESLVQDLTEDDSL